MQSLRKATLQQTQPPQSIPQQQLHQLNEAAAVFSAATQTQQLLHEQQVNADLLKQIRTLEASQSQMKTEIQAAAQYNFDTAVTFAREWGQHNQHSTDSSHSPQQ